MTTLDHGLIWECVQKQLASFAEKKRQPQHSTDHFILKLDHEGGGGGCGQSTPSRKRKRQEPTAVAVTAPSPGTESATTTAQGRFLLEARDAMEGVCRQDDALRSVLVQSTTTLQARHCQLTRSSVISDDSSGTESPNTVAAFLFSSALCTAWASHLTCLDLECNTLGDDGVRALTQCVLPRLPQLESLHLASNAIGVSGLEALSSWSLTTAEGEAAIPPVRVLGLTNNPLCTSPSLEADNGVAALLATMLQRWRGTIRRLHLNHVGLDANTVAALLLRLSSSLHEGGSGFAFPHLDTLYMKQNGGLHKATLETAIRSVFTDAQTTTPALTFVETYFLLE